MSRDEVDEAARAGRERREGSAPSARDGTGPRWYACYTRARHEKKVEARLEERGFEAFLPLVPRVRQWHDREKVVSFPMFPGYVFARFDLKRLHRVVATPGLVHVISFAGGPVPIPEEEIENVRRFARALDAAVSDPDPEPEPLVSVGEPVRVVEGPFRDVVGRVAERRGGGRVLFQVGLEAIRQGVKVEVEERHLEPVEGGGPRLPHPAEERE